VESKGHSRQELQLRVGGLESRVGKSVDECSLPSRWLRIERATFTNGPIFESSAQSSHAPSMYVDSLPFTAKVWRSCSLSRYDVYRTWLFASIARSFPFCLRVDDPVFSELSSKLGSRLAADLLPRRHPTRAATEIRRQRDNSP
jgi:hypothetical protein